MAAAAPSVPHYAPHDLTTSERCWTAYCRARCAAPLLPCPLRQLMRHAPTPFTAAWPTSQLAHRARALHQSTLPRPPHDTCTCMDAAGQQQVGCAPERGRAQARTHQNSRVYPQPRPPLRIQAPPLPLDVAPPITCCARAAHRAAHPPARRHAPEGGHVPLGATHTSSPFDPRLAAAAAGRGFTHTHTAPASFAAGAGSASSLSPPSRGTSRFPRVNVGCCRACFLARGHVQHPANAHARAGSRAGPRPSE